MHHNFNVGKSLIVAGVGATNNILNPGNGTFLSAILQNYTARGIKLVIDVTALTPASTLVVTILGIDPVSGKTYTILASATITATGTTILTVYPGIPAAANVSANDTLPFTWRVQAVAGAGGLFTATIGASLQV